MPLRYLFVDMNAYFASVEQQDFPELRGKPIAVVPMQAETTCCLAASYEAKARGVKTGTPVWQARGLCPGIVFRTGRHDRYVEVHEKIVKAVGLCIPVAKIMSIDEMACKLIGDERTTAKATKIAHHIKLEIRARVGEYLRCSIGVAPNGMMAKVAGDMQKPDGLTIIHTEELPTRMYCLKITDFPGIGPRMEKRFNLYNVFTVQQLYTLTVKQLSQVWGSKIHGERWFHLLRGDEVYEKPTKRKTLGHSHVLPPDLRNDVGTRGVFIKLIHKAAARMRSIDYWTDTLTISVRYEDGARWEVRTHVPRCQDTLNLLRAFIDLWEHRPQDRTPLKVSMVLTNLVPTSAATPSLFEHDRQVTTLSHVMDQVNRTFGKQSIHFGTLIGSEDTAPTRIAFGEIPKFNPATE